MNEFVIEWVRGRMVATVTAPAKSWLKSRVLKLKEAYPDDVDVAKENSDGSIVAHVPVRWVKISPPRKISEKQRQEFSERMKRMWEQKSEEGYDEWDEEEWDEEEE